MFTGFPDIQTVGVTYAFRGSSIQLLDALLTKFDAPHKMYDAIKQFLTEEDGPTSVEYAVMLSLIAGACIASVLVLSNAVGASFDDSASQLSGAFGS